MRRSGTGAVALLVVTLSGCAQSIEVRAASDGLDCNTDGRSTSSSSWGEYGPPTFASPEEAVRDRLGLGDEDILKVGEVRSRDGFEEVDVLIQTDGQWQTLVELRHDDDGLLANGWYANGVTECA